MQQRNLKMNEEDTYNALRKWTFEETREIVHELSINRLTILETQCKCYECIASCAELYRITGWTIDEFDAEYQRRDNV